MGFIDDLLFPGSSKKTIGKVKFKEKVRPMLANRNISERHRDEVEKIFMGDIHEQGSQKGIDKKELEERIKWMRIHPSDHYLSKGEIDTVEEVMGAMLGVKEPK